MPSGRQRQQGGVSIAQTALEKKNMKSLVRLGYTQHAAKCELSLKYNKS